MSGCFRLSDAQPVFQARSNSSWPDHSGQFATTTANILKFHRHQFSTIIPQDGINRVKPNDIRTMSTRGKAQERDFITVAIPGNYDNDKNRRGKLSLCRVRVLRILFQTVRHLRV